MFIHMRDPLGRSVLTRSVVKTVSVVIHKLAATIKYSLP